MRKSPLKVKCRKLLFNLKSCEWQPVSIFRAVEFKARGGDETAIVHRSTKSPGLWQVSFFDDRGPVRDSQHSKIESALREVSPKRWRLKSFG